MQTNETNIRNDLMAFWQATGGALEAAEARREAIGDDGLEAMSYSRNWPYCAGEDGLHATALSAAWACPHGADDGLQAASLSVSPRCFA